MFVIIYAPLGFIQLHQLTAWECDRATQEKYIESSTSLEAVAVLVETLVFLVLDIEQFPVLNFFPFLGFQ